MLTNVNQRGIIPHKKRDLRMRTRKRHPNKEIEQAIKYAESKLWRYMKPGKSAHAWGRLLCPLQKVEGCAMSVWSTPRNPSIHAKQIYRRVDACPH